MVFRGQAAGDGERQRLWSFSMRLCEGIMKWPWRAPPSDKLWALVLIVFSPNHLVCYSFLFLSLFLFETRKSFAVSLLSSKIIAFCEKTDGEHY